jgi:hypothetical protein
MPDAPPAIARSRAARTGYWLVVAIVGLVAAAKAVLHGPIDPDLFLHLIAAEHLVKDGIGPIVDATSYMSKPTPWTPYSWLAELGMKWVIDAWGHRGAVASYALMSAGLAAGIGWACLETIGRRASGPDDGPRADEPSPTLTAAAIATLAGTFLSLPYLSFRPVTLTLALMTVCAALLYRDRAHDRQTRAVWLVVPMTVLLINLHLFAVLVAAWTWALCTGDGITYGPRDRRTIRAGVLAVATSLACLTTPMLPGVVASMVQYQFTDPIVAGGEIAEFRPFYYGGMGKVSLGIVLAMLAALAVGRKRMTWADWASVALACLLLLRMGRLAPVFAIIVAPLAARCAPRGSDKALSRPFVRAVLAVVLIAMSVRLYVALPRPGTTLREAANDAKGYPSAAAQFVESNVTRRSGRIINGYSWGGYLAWRLNPKFKILMTGNTPAFPIDLWTRTYYCDPETRRATLAATNADAAILRAGKDEFDVALNELGWTTVYSDRLARVLVPSTTVKARASIPGDSHLRGVLGDVVRHRIVPHQKLAQLVALCDEEIHRLVKLTAGKVHRADEVVGTGRHVQVFVPPVQR